MTATSAILAHDRSRTLWTFVFGAWTVYGLVHGTIWTATNPEPGEALRWTYPTAMVVAWTWALITPAVFRLARLLAPSRVGWLPSALGHATAALAIAAGLTWIRSYAMELASGFGQERFLPAFLFWVDVWVIVYITLVVIGRALDLRRRYADRTMRADLLEAQLARAQLQFLESQLQPHFLFNALNTIQELAHEAPHAAARTLNRLRSLLAISLERYGYDEVTLGDELAGLEPYLDIQRTRFSDWLSVDLDVPADARAAMVPHLVLQPLVENAIRHGLSVRQAPGRIRIAARREGEWLRVVVDDNGIGLVPGAREKRGGIGLQNVADRLRQLYGTEHRFVIGSRPEGGVEVTLKVPYRVGAPMTSPPQPLETFPSEDEIASWRTGEFEGSRIDNGRGPKTGEFPRFREATAHLAEGGEGHGEVDAPVVRTAETSPALSPRVWLGIAGVWLLLAVFWTNQIVLFTSASNRDAQFTLWSLAQMQVVTSIIWLAMSLPILWLARRFRLTADNWPARLPVHVALALACGFVHLGTMRLVGISEAPVLSRFSLNPLTGDFFIYLAFLAWSHSRDFVAWFRQRDLETARLSAQIARSRFQNLRVQLRPEFLLATLERLSELVHTDVDRAERLIVRLADTLRQTLDLSRESLVSLAQELELVSASIETHRLGIRSGVRLELAIDEEALSEPIPSRLVCTLVDELLANVAIPPDAPLQVGIDATRVSGYTQITVSANAEGLGTRNVSHTWLQRHGVAERAVKSAGAGVSVLIPDRTSVMVMIGTETGVEEVGPLPPMVAAGAQ